MSWKDKLRNGWVRLASEIDSRQRAEVKLLEALERDSTEERAVAAALRKVREKVKYDHLRAKLDELAAIEEHHAALLEEKIRELRQDLPQDVASLAARRDSRQVFSSLDLLSVVEAEKEKYADYLQNRGLAKEADRPDIAQLLDRIRREESVHRKELLDLLTRLNPLPLD